MKQSLYDLMDIWLGIAPIDPPDRFIEFGVKSEIVYQEPTDIIIKEAAKTKQKRYQSSYYRKIKQEREEAKQTIYKIGDKIDWKLVKKLGSQYFQY